MRIYLDVSCLNRRFDDQSQNRVFMETEALEAVFEMIQCGEWMLVSSEIAVFEIAGIADATRREQVELLLPGQHAILEITDKVRERADLIVTLGIKPADAMHVASAEAWSADVMLTCDDRLEKKARRSKLLKVRVVNPLTWMKEQTTHDDAG